LLAWDWLGGRPNKAGKDFELASTTTAAPRRFTGWRQPAGRLTGGFAGQVRPALGARTRQMVLITLLVSAVVMIMMLTEVVHMTAVIIRRTHDQASRISSQIIYAVGQAIAPEAIGSDQPPAHPYDIIAGKNSAVRTLMESTFGSPGPISYLYLTDDAGNMVGESEGHPLVNNEYMIDPNPRDLTALTNQSAFRQLKELFLGPQVYEYQGRFEDRLQITGIVHVGVSARSIRSELRSPIETDMLIGLCLIVVGAIVALGSANSLLKPLEVISTSIDRLNSGDDAAGATTTPLKKPSQPREDLVSGVTARLRQLGERMAGDRSELEIMRGRLRQVISHLEERLLLINREGRVILASPEAESLLGAGQTELTGLPIDESLGLNHPLVRLVEQSLSERRSISRATLSAPRGDETYQLLASVQYIEDSGEPVGALVSIRDYDSFQKLESQWDLSKKLADLGRITSGIAHEVKNPLNAMVIHLEILRSKIESGQGNPAPQIEILDSEIKRLDRVVQTFLNFTRPVEARLDPIDMNSLVGQVNLLAVTEASEMGVEIFEDLSLGPIFVKGDSDLLKQALLNVIINGCQAMPDGGPLKVTTLPGADGYAHILVADRGVGIGPEAKDRIFNLYYTTKSDGTGIGLAQAFRAVQMHNGQIRFESELGVGTTFEILLPLSAPPKPQSR
jgi:PAS domain S-box-containing protein